MWLDRAAELLKNGYGAVSGAPGVAFATSMMATLYGPESPQLRQFRDGCAAITKVAPNPRNLDYSLGQHAVGAILNTTGELKAGLIIRVRAVVAGEVLQELLRLAKEVLAGRTDEAKNAAAVLTAAAYEGLIRKIGEEFAGVTGRPKLEEVISALKAANIFKGGQVGIAQSYLKFRNDSLHADWENVDRSQVESCLAFSESLLLKHLTG
jgi:hypothetical protein